METLKVTVRSKAAKNLLLDLEELKLLKIEGQKKTGSSKLKRRIKKDLKEGFRQVKLHEQGKVKLKSLDELLDEL
jgi:hypothetical protein